MRCYVAIMWIQDIVCSSVNKCPRFGVTCCPHSQDSPVYGDSRFLLEGWNLTTKLHGITALRSLNVVCTVLQI